MKKGLGSKFWAAMLIFGLVGQVAWVVENMYLNVFIYKMFHASAADISLMVGASSVAATLTTILIGALSDKIGKRKLLICLGYIVWGISIIGFAFIRMDILTEVTGDAVTAGALGVTLVIVLDCVMTFFGSAANDASYNAWLTDRGDESNRGKIEGFNSMMPLVSILVVFDGFMSFNLDLAESWEKIFYIIGLVVMVIGVLGFFLIEDSGVKKSTEPYWKTVIYSFQPSVIVGNKLLYAVLAAFAIFGISIQTYMPYLILYYEKSLGMADYVLVMAPAIVIAAVITALYGKVYDMSGFKTSVMPSVGMLLGGYVILFLAKDTVPVFIGSLFMMTGYMTGMSVFGAMIRDRIPEEKAGQFQGIRIIGQVLIPGIIGPAIGAFVLRDAEQILNNDGTYSFLPNTNIWVAAFFVGVILCGALWGIFYMMRTGHYELWSESGEKVSSGQKISWNEYPRPQLKREGYLILKDGWLLNGQMVRMPFPPESKLSGYQGKVGKELVYETAFTVPESFGKEKILLHFGAVDQVAEVWLNETMVGAHEGGYLPFTFDITESVNRTGENKLKVKATDTLSRDYPYGKQTKKRGGMWYTPVSGIWQNVWIENVAANYVENIKIKPDDGGIDIVLQGNIKGFATTVMLENGQSLRRYFSGKTGRVNLADAILDDGSHYQPTLWTPEKPHLYEMKIETQEDTVYTYFALRTIEIAKIDGVNRVCLNGKPVFLHGVLDQGYFCDGLYLPAEEREYERDILRMKELGFNLLRKHIKVEAECFYYACDRLGMMVMQDMVNSGSYHFIRDTALPTFGMKKWYDEKGTLTGKQREFFISHTKETIEHLYNHPSIVSYTIFNEGWGQFHSDKLYEMVKKWDDTRLVDSTSGWFAQKKNDFDSEHIYFKTIDLDPKERPMFVTECGGYSMYAEGHIYSKYNQYGYGACDDSHTLTEEIANMYRKMIIPSIPKGTCGCVYTQLSDVEDEINGLYTYDRKVCKVEPELMQRVAAEIRDVM